MLNNQFHLKRTSGITLPYGHAFVLTIGLATTASLNCHCVLQNEAEEDVFWTKQPAS